jgi:PAS domain S-box-containing protein
MLNYLSNIPLAESEKKLRSLFKTMSEGIVYEDHEGKIISANPAAERLLGLSFEQMQGRTSVDPCWKAIHADGSPFPGETHSLNLAAKTGKPATGEVMGIYNPKSDAYVWLSVNSTPEFLPGEKKPFQAYAVFRDITERKQAEENLIVSEVRYRRLFEAAKDGILILDAETGVIVDVNPFLCEMLGFSHEEICGKELWEMGFFKDIAESKANFLGLQEKGYIRYDDLPLEIANGRKFHVEFVSNVYQVNHHKVVQCNIRDITERKQVEQKLAHYSEHLEEMVEARTIELREAQEKLVRNEKLAVLGQLAGSVGHELRNPLAVINNALYYLKLIGADSSEKVKEYLGIIQTETRTAEKIITDLLDFARIKSMDMEPVSASYLAARVLERYPAPQAVNVTLEIPEDLPMLYVDPRQVEQVLGNLVINACQSMSTGGELTITAHQEQEMIAIAVKDTGVGIPPENMKKLFEPLFTTKAKGIGLGLAVSQKLAEANGGSIEVQSEAGVGSTFTVYLPVKL